MACDPFQLLFGGRSNAIYSVANARDLLENLDATFSTVRTWQIISCGDSISQSVNGQSTIRPLQWKVHSLPQATTLFTVCISVDKLLLLLLPSDLVNVFCGLFLCSSRRGSTFPNASTFSIFVDERTHIVASYSQFFEPPFSQVYFISLRFVVNDKDHSIFITFFLRSE